MPAWPSNLPQFFQEGGYSETLPNQRIESQNDSGPPKVRRRFTTNWRPIEGDIWCTGEQAEDFEEFFEDDLAGGTLSFTWVNPITQDAQTFKFRGGAPRKSVRGEIVIFRLQLWQLP